MTTQKIAELLEETINPTSPLGLNIGIVLARLEFAQRQGEAAFVELIKCYEFTGNDLRADAAKRALADFRSVLLEEPVS